GTISKAFGQVLWSTSGDERERDGSGPQALGDWQNRAAGHVDVEKGAVDMLRIYDMQPLSDSSCLDDLAAKLEQNVLHMHRDHCVVLHDQDLQGAVRSNGL